MSLRRRWRTLKWKRTWQGATEIRALGTKLGLEPRPPDLVTRGDYDHGEEPMEFFDRCYQEIQVELTWTPVSGLQIGGSSDPDLRTYGPGWPE